MNVRWSHIMMWLRCSSGISLRDRQILRTAKLRTAETPMKSKAVVIVWDQYKFWIVWLDLKYPSTLNKVAPTIIRTQLMQNNKIVTHFTISDFRCSCWVRWVFTSSIFILPFDSLVWSGTSKEALKYWNVKRQRASPFKLTSAPSRKLEIVISTLPVGLIRMRIYKNRLHPDSTATNSTSVRTRPYFRSSRVIFLRKSKERINGTMHW